MTAMQIFLTSVIYLCSEKPVDRDAKLTEELSGDQVAAATSVTPQDHCTDNTSADKPGMTCCHIFDSI